MNTTCPCSLGLVDPTPEPIMRYRVTRGKDGRVRIQYAAATKLITGQGGKLASSRSKNKPAERGGETLLDRLKKCLKR